MANRPTLETPHHAKIAAITLSLLGAACYGGVEPELDSEGRGGNIPGRWLLPADVSEISEATWVEINGSPAGVHKNANCSEQFLPGAKVLKEYIQSEFDGVLSIGGYVCRPINWDYSKQTSIHGMGRALDIHVACQNCPANNVDGDVIAHWLIENAEEIGIQRIIWDESHWKAVGYTQNAVYGGSHNHHDHLHVELNLDGGWMHTPWFEDQGYEIPPQDPEPEPEPEPEPDPPPQDDCPNPCWPEFEIGTTCDEDLGLVECRDFDDDGCTELQQVETCGDEDACYGDPGQAACCEGAFCDDEGNLFEGSIDYLAAEDITYGCGTGPEGQPLYCPDDGATRAQVIVMLARATGMPGMESPDAFTDDDGHWAEHLLNAAYFHGITQGKAPGLFGPDDPATRTHVAAFISNYYDLPAANGDHFTDDDDQPAWVQSVHNRLYEAGITTGCGADAFCGGDVATRDQLAAFVQRSHEKLAKPTW